MITTILFDLDDTLLDFTKAEAIALHRALEEAGLPAGKRSSLYRPPSTAADFWNIRRLSGKNIAA